MRSILTFPIICFSFILYPVHSLASCWNLGMCPLIATNSFPSRQYPLSHPTTSCSYLLFKVFMPISSQFQFSFIFCFFLSTFKWVCLIFFLLQTMQEGNRRQMVFLWYQVPWCTSTWQTEIGNRDFREGFCLVSEASSQNTVQMETLNLNHKNLEWNFVKFVKLSVTAESFQYFLSDEFLNVIKFHDTQEVKQFF